MIFILSLPFLGVPQWGGDTQIGAQIGGSVAGVSQRVLFFS